MAASRGQDLVRLWSPGIQPDGLADQLNLDDEDMRVLVAEDDESIRTMLGTWLRRLGHEPILAVDGLQGILLFNERKPDLVITDCWMPQVTGTTLTHHVKGQDPDIPVIILTGFSERFSRAEAERLGANEYLQKPINLAQLQQIIEMHDRYSATHPTPTL